MIIEGLFNLFFGIVDLVLDLLPDFNIDLGGGFEAFMELLSYALYFFPSDLWTAIIVNVVIWLFGAITWSIIEWIYKKIPGVD